MDQTPNFSYLFSKNDPKRDIDKTWQHDLFEPYEALFKADEQQLRVRENHRSAQVKWSDLELNASNRQCNQTSWSKLEPKVSNLQTAQIHLSNLEKNVTTEDLYDLFSLIGNLKAVHLDRDKNGQSEETAVIIFERNEDAMEAMYRYNGCLLDNKALIMELMDSSSETTFPVCYKNIIPQNVQTNDVAAQSHMDMQDVVHYFNSLTLQ